MQQIKNLIKKSVNLISSLIEYVKLELKCSVHLNKKSDKAVLVNLSNPEIYHRYLYTLLKFYSLEGYAIFYSKDNYSYFKKNIFKFYRHPPNLYNLIFKENLVIFGKTPKKHKTVIELNDNNISSDYFTPLLQNKKVKTSYHVPMAMNPLFYHYRYWNKEVNDINKRKKSIFMAGNLDRAAYSEFSNSPFKIESRIEIYDYLYKNKMLKKINSTNNLNEFLKSNEDNVCIILDSRENWIKMQGLRKVLNNFYFYLALPGVVMPFSHNLIEALSVGTIPIIHREYAILMLPHLEHLKNAILYDNIDDIATKIDFAYNLDKETLLKLKSNVNQYYIENLTPKSVINKITKGKFDLLYIQAEHTSIKVLQNK